MTKNNIVIFFTVFVSLLLSTLIAIFLAQGYKFDLPKRKIQKTGMLLVKSTPGDAKIYLDGKLLDTTPTTLGSLEPGRYNLKIEKEDHTFWQKEVEILPELATEVDALLIAKSPRLEPLTKTGISLLCLSPDGRQVVYTSRGEDSKGIWILDLTAPPILGLVRENPRLLTPDTERHAFSLTEDLTFSPKGNQILLTLNKEGYLLLNLNDGDNPTATTSAEPTLSTWEEELKSLKEKWAKRLDLTGDLEKIALDSDTLWSPDRKRFLFPKERDNYVEWHIYNGENPLGIGRKREYAPLKFKKDEEVKITWHQTSRHLIVQKQGTISLVEIDGGNQIEVLSLDLSDPRVFPTPDGANLIILTSFKKNGAPNLYAIGLR